MKIKTVKNPKHSNCKGDQEYFVTANGKDFYCMRYGSVLWIDGRDVAKAKIN